jgi:hypothetical protein
MASRSSGAGATSALPPLRRRGGDQHHLPPLSLGSGLPRMSGRAVVVGACPGGRQMGPARGCRRVPGKDARDGVAATERHRSGAFSAPPVQPQKRQNRPGGRFAGPIQAPSADSLMELR